MDLIVHTGLCDTR